MVKTPPYLSPGDTVGIVCPSGFMAAEKVQACIDALRSWGYLVKTGMTVGAPSADYFSATDADRLADLQEMLDDEKIRAIICARGGYGMTRIIDDIHFEKFIDHPKWIIGFSDITLLQTHILSNFNISCIHGPMAAAFEADDGKNEYVRSVRKALEGKKISYSVVPSPHNRKGEAIGELVGGNLAMLAHGIGTRSEIKTKGRILFLEDVGEYLYNVDRMLRQLQRAGKFERLAGLIVGAFTEMKDTQRPFGKSLPEIIGELVAGYDFPVCFDFPVGHQRENYALKTGVGYKLAVGRKKVTLAE